ncbi:hypothetical protein HUT19_04340 [Streptomyces sp. NA02950]|uniref:hypothetical protein n=1 Tax=Streptomyces sp. NA02950 TaxID=2742137 RepID=UPI001591D3FB|nr:hypothetical protein [Streptomyces sp. NA02950]QKV91063.1 hypothetical protein HUT19_04340 [Streptomyces sp. NA02950]
MRETAWGTSRLQIEVREPGDGRVVVALTGDASFLRLPGTREQLEGLPTDRPVELDPSGVRHIDLAGRVALENWARRHDDAGTEPVRMLPPAQP